MFDPIWIIIILAAILAITTFGLLAVLKAKDHEVYHLRRNLQDTWYGVRVDENHPILDAILSERRKNAGDFSVEGSGVRGEAKDKAILACYYAVEKVLKSTGTHTPTK